MCVRYKTNTLCIQWLWKGVQYSGRLFTCSATQNGCLTFLESNEVWREERREGGKEGGKKRGKEGGREGGERDAMFSGDPAPCFFLPQYLHLCHYLADLLLCSDL